MYDAPLSFIFIFIFFLLTILSGGQLDIPLALSGAKAAPKAAPRAVVDLCWIPHVAHDGYLLSLVAPSLLRLHRADSGFFLLKERRWREKMTMMKTKRKEENRGRWDNPWTCPALTADLLFFTPFSLSDCLFLFLFMYIFGHQASLCGR